MSNLIKVKEIIKDLCNTCLSRGGNCEECRHDCKYFDWWDETCDRKFLMADIGVVAEFIEDVKITEKDIYDDITNTYYYVDDIEEIAVKKHGDCYIAEFISRCNGKHKVAQVRNVDGEVIAQRHVDYDTALDDEYWNALIASAKEGE